MMLNYYVFYDLGYICVIMDNIKGSEIVRLSKFYKVVFSLDCSL